MTQVDFYVLPDDAAQGRQLLACRIAEKAYQQGLRVHLHTQNQQAAELMDRLLWTFRQNSFIPHGIINPNQDPAETVQIGFGQEPHPDANVLINLHAELPLFFSRFDRVAEILDQSPEVLSEGRTRFKFYKDRGYPLQTHKL